jgi:hypothetical protein
MTNFYGPSSPTEVNDGYPGAAPVPGVGNQMTGNPNIEQNGVTINLPGNQNSSGAPLTTQMSNGNIIASSVPTNVLSAPGTDSLLAQLSRGQVILSDSTYGQSQYIPGNAASPNPINGTATISSIPTGPASGLTYPAAGSAQNYTGN